MVQCVFASGPDWIQAFAAVAIVILSGWTLIVLREYAADTRKIAQSSLKQTENSQLPFLAVFFQPNTAVDQEGWVVQNKGSGTAINISLSAAVADKVEHIPSLAAGARYTIHRRFSPVEGNQEKIDVKYESLSGLEYRTLITWIGGVMHTQFVRPGL
jgi:hypothetical protein